MVLLELILRLMSVRMRLLISALLETEISHGITVSSLLLMLPLQTQDQS